MTEKKGNKKRLFNLASMLKYLNNYWMDCCEYYTDIHGPQMMKPSDL